MSRTDVELLVGLVCAGNVRSSEPEPPPLSQPTSGDKTRLRQAIRGCWKERRTSSRLLIGV